jgi:hypothetical protein
MNQQLSPPFTPNDDVLENATELFFKNNMKLTRDEFQDHYYKYAIHRQFANGGKIYHCDHEQCSKLDRGMGFCYLHCSCTTCTTEHKVYDQYCQYINGKQDEKELVSCPNFAGLDNLMNVGNAWMTKCQSNSPNSKS